MPGTYFNITVAAEWCTFIVALLLLNKSTTNWQWFKLFLLITLIAESLGWYYRFVLNIRNNNWIYNILLLVSIPFFGWIFGKAEPLAKIRNAIDGVTVAVLLAGLINFIFIQGIWVYNIYTEVIKDIFFAVSACFFFFNILKEEKFRNLFRYEYFWLANSLLFYGLGNIVFYLFRPMLINFYYENHINLINILNSVLNVLFYSSLIAAFICRSKTTK